MKRFICLIAFLIVGLLLVNISMAGDVDDIKKATMEHFANQNAGDAKAHMAHHMPNSSAFPPGGGLLNVNTSREEQVKGMQATFDAGVKFNLRLRHLNVQVYGKAAVVTGYVVGSVTGPDGESQQVMTRRTAVLVKEGGEWKEAHTHSSPVVAPE